MTAEESPSSGPLGNELKNVLVTHDDLQEVMDEVAASTARWLSRHAPEIECGIVVERPKRKTVVSGSSPETARLLTYWVESRNEALYRALEGGETVIERAERGRLPWPGFVRPLSLIVMNVDADHAGRGAMALMGRLPRGPSRRLIGLAGGARNQINWSLHLAARYQEQRELAENRAKAMENRTAIDLAVGIIMGQNRCSPEKAFEVLRRASNARNEKIQYIARELARKVGGGEVTTAFDA